MNYMKKTYRIIILSSILIVLVVGLILIVSYKRKQIYTFLTVPYDYYVSTSDEQTIDFLVFTKEWDTPYLKEENILRSNLAVSMSKDSYQVHIDEIEKMGLAKYEDEQYTQFRLHIYIPLSSKDIINLDDVYLNLEYENEEELSLPLGNICIFPSVLTSDIYYSSLKGITKDVNGDKTLVGVVTKINTKKDIKIKHIIPLHNKSKINSEYTKIISIDEADTTLPIDYNPLDNSIKDKELDINIHNDDYLFIALAHENSSGSSLMGFKIIYLDEGVEKYFVINPFRFFSDDSLYQVEKTVYETTSY